MYCCTGVEQLDEGVLGETTVITEPPVEALRLKLLLRPRMVHILRVQLVMPAVQLVDELGLAEALVPNSMHSALVLELLLGPRAIERHLGCCC